MQLACVVYLLLSTKLQIILFMKFILFVFVINELSLLLLDDILRIKGKEVI